MRVSSHRVRDFTVKGPNPFTFHFTVKFHVKCEISRPIVYVKFHGEFSREILL